MLVIKRMGPLLEVLSIFAVFCASGQEIMQSESVRVTLPSRAWVRTPLPTARTSQNQPEILKPLLFAEAHHGQLKLHVTQFDYPVGITEQQLAIFVDHVRDRYQSHAFGPIQETSSRLGGLPSVELDVKYRGWNSMRARAVFCDKKVYLMEVGGPSEYQTEANQCWNALTVVGESPLPATTFEKIIEIRKKAHAEIMAYSTPPSKAAIYLLEFLATAAGVLGALWLTIKLAKKIRSGTRFKFGRRRRRHRHRSPLPTAPAHANARSTVGLARG